MNTHKTNVNINTCLKNCDTNCVFTIDFNDHLTMVINPSNSKNVISKLCPHAFRVLQLNNDSNRIRFPYYQEKKGSGKFKKISWEHAYTLILNRFIDIYSKNGMFLPVAWHKGTANSSILNFAVDEFFQSIGKTTKILPNNYLYDLDYQLEKNDIQSYDNIITASLIIIWGQNTAANYTYLLPKIMEAKAKGCKIFVVDPIFTKTANMADFYLEIEPNTDTFLLHDLLILLSEKNINFKQEVINFLTSFHSDKDIKFLSDLSREKLETIFYLLIDSKKTVHIIGAGIQKHSSFSEFERILEMFNSILRKEKGESVTFKRKRRLKIFNNQRLENDSYNRITNWNSIICNSDKNLQKNPIELLWISGSNPISQTGNSKLMKQIFFDIPFIVTTEHFMTPTAKMSNLILPATTNLEELNLIINNIDYTLQLNERKLDSHFDSKSEFTILNELADYFKKCMPNLINFPTYLSEEDYLNKQWNEDILRTYYIENVTELRDKKGIQPANINYLSSKYVKEEKTQSNFSSPISEIKKTTNDFPFFLITPHHPHMFNSQFLYFPTVESKEAFALMNEQIAQKYGIVNNEIIIIFNSFTSIEIKVILTKNIHEHVLMIYNGSNLDSEYILNQVVSSDTLFIKNEYKTISHQFFFDTFVNIEKRNNKAY